MNKPNWEGSYLRIVLSLGLFIGLSVISIFGVVGLAESQKQIPNQFQYGLWGMFTIFPLIIVIITLDVNRLLPYTIQYLKYCLAKKRGDHNDE